MLPFGKTSMPLVGVSLGGGLGNQMFQYAAGLSLAGRLGAELRCDAHHFAGGGQRRLGLHEFGLSWTECRNPRANGALRAIARALGAPKSRPFRGAPYLDEVFGGFDPRFNELSAPCYLNGYFQSWRYLEGQEASVRRAFDFRRIAGKNTAPMAARIEAARHSVAVHLRLDDYANDPAKRAFHGVLGADYYQAARRAIEAKVETPTYFLFSDEPARAKAELGWPDLVVVEGHSPHEDLMLMARCRHFIIANSTFSWWGAWLGQAPDKQVIAPINWFAPAHAAITMLDDRYPADWVRV